MTQKRESSGITPAALGAALAGDMANFLVAATPGGIEAQEAAGQRTFCQSETLPTKGLAEYADKLTALGFVIGSPVEDDPLFTQCHLPPGWKKQATDHSMWSDLIDNMGRRRAGMFYKAAFYDRKAHIMWEFAIGYKIRTTDGRHVYDVKDNEPAQLVGTVEHCGKEVHRTEPIGVVTRRDSFAAEDTLRSQLLKWIKANYPDYENPFAYWS